MTSFFAMCFSTKDAEEPTSGPSEDATTAGMSEFEKKLASLNQGTPVLSESNRKSYTSVLKSIAKRPSRAARKSSTKLWKVLYHFDVGDIVAEDDSVRAFWTTIQNGFGNCELHAEDVPHSHVLLHLDLPTDLSTFGYAKYVRYAQQKLCAMQTAQCTSKVIRTATWLDRGWTCP